MQIWALTDLFTDKLLYATKNADHPYVLISPVWFCNLLRPVWCLVLPPFIVCCLEIYLELVSQPICQLTVIAVAWSLKLFLARQTKFKNVIVKLILNARLLLVQMWRWMWKAYFVLWKHQTVQKNSGRNQILFACFAYFRGRVLQQLPQSAFQTSCIR